MNPAKQWIEYLIESVLPNTTLAQVENVLLQSNTPMEDVRSIVRPGVDPYLFWKKLNDEAPTIGNILSILGKSTVDGLREVTNQKLSPVDLIHLMDNKNPTMSTLEWFQRNRALLFDANQECGK